MNCLFQPFLRFYRRPPQGSHRVGLFGRVSTLLEILRMSAKYRALLATVLFQPFLRFYGVQTADTLRRGRWRVSTLLEILLPSGVEAPETVYVLSFQPFLRFYGVYIGRVSCRSVDVSTLLEILLITTSLHRGVDDVASSFNPS